MKAKPWVLFLLFGSLAACQPDPNDYAIFKAAAFGEVARVQFREGHVAAARATARFASQAVAAVSEDERGDFLKIAAAVAHTRAGDSAGASQIIADLDDVCLGPPIVALAQADMEARADAAQSIDAALESLKSNTEGCSSPLIRTIIAWAQAKSGDVAGALAAIADISRPGAKDEAFALVSEELLSLGNVQRALEVANLISHAESESNIQISIFLIRGVALDPGRAVDSMQSDLGISPAVRTLADVAAALSASGDAAGAERTIELALEAVNELSDSEIQVRASALVAMVQWQNGDSVAANRTLSNLTRTANNLHIDGRSRALGAIAAAQFFTGDTVGGNITLDQIPQGHEHSSTLPRVAIFQANRGDIPSALNTLDYILDPSDRLRVLIAIAAFQAEQGDFPSANRSIALAQETLQEIDGGGPLALLLLCKSQAEAGNFEAALATAGSIRSLY